MEKAATGRRTPNHILPDGRAIDLSRMLGVTETLNFRGKVLP